MKPEASIYLHCDPTASHYLKELMDAIFGRKNFRNEIVWCYTQGGRSKKDLPRKHDIILRYSRSKSYIFNIDTIKIPYELVSTKSADSFTKVDKDGRLYKEVYGSDRKRKYRYYKDEGKTPYDWWVDIPQVTGRASASKKSENTGHPTQKPLRLYERIIKASSNEGDIVLDPFCGCATTCVVAERLGRQWVGIDLWNRAHEVVLDRFRKEGFSAKGHSGDRLAFGKVHYINKLPGRTDDGQISVPYLKVKEREHKPRETTISRTSMFHQLIIQQDPRCQGCDRTFDDPRYLELDHRQPRSDGGSNELSNRILLCSPCNRLKSNTLTLIGLRRQNKKLGYMADSERENPIMRKIRREHEKAPKLFE